MSNSCNPMDCSLLGSSVHGISQARIPEWLPFPSPGDLPNPGIKIESLAWQVDFLPLHHLGRPVNLLLSHFSCVWLCVTPWTAAHQAPPSLGFSKQEPWSGLPFSNAWKWKVKVKSLSRVCLTLSDPMDYSLPGSSAHGIFQARGLESGAIAWSVWIYSLCQINRQRISHCVIFVTSVIRDIKSFELFISLVNCMFLSCAHFPLLVGVCRHLLHWCVRPLLYIWDLNSLVWLFLNIIWSGGFWPTHLMWLELQSMSDEGTFDWEAMLYLL